MRLFSSVIDLITYKEPADAQAFELLEDEPQEDDEAALWEVDPEDSAGLREAMAAGKRKSRIAKWIGGKAARKPAQSREPDFRVSGNLQENLKRIKAAFNCPVNEDVVIRQFKVLGRLDAFIVYMEGMADKAIINDYILRQLMKPGDARAMAEKGPAAYLAGSLLSVNQVTMRAELGPIIQQVLCGMTALFVEKVEECILIESRGFEKRNVANPLTETVIKGPHEGFIENLRTNITLIRKIIRNKDLITQMLPIGKVGHLTCAVLYMKGTANPKVLKELKRRIGSIDIDQVAGDGVLDQLIEDHTYSLLPQILSTERPDRTAYFLMEGKVALICDGTPYASIVPVTFFEMFHTSEDYALRWQYGTFLRLVRMAAALLAVFFPGFYVALTLYHPEMIPTELLSSLAKAREHLPFPTIIEILLMEGSFELIREAGIRVPGVIGQTLGIIGAIILGQAAVAAGLVSPVLIIVISITGLGSFAIPNYSMAFGLRLSRFAFVFCGAIAGFYGIAAGIFISGGLACSMKSFGVPFFSPVAPKTKSNQDVIVRAPGWKLTMRPDFSNAARRMRTDKEAVRGWAARERKEGRS